MPDDYDKFAKERKAAAHLRDGVSYVLGMIEGREPEAAKLLQAHLDQHAEDREQDVF